MWSWKKGCSISLVQEFVLLIYLAPKYAYKSLYFTKKNKYYVINIMHFDNRSCVITNLIFHQVKEV